MWKYHRLQKELYNFLLTLSKQWGLGDHDLDFGVQISQLAQKSETKTKNSVLQMYYELGS